MINKENILKVLHASKKSTKNILVIGDVMLDQYIYGQSNRLSPEAPVPVVRYENSENRLGGAANVAANLKALHSNVQLIGLISHDENGQLLTSLLRAQQISAQLFPFQSCTTMKQRIIAQKQQVLRIDHEQPVILEREMVREICEYVEIAVQEASMVIISDYAKGMCKAEICQFAIHRCQQLNIPVIVDPKGTDWTKYRGAQYITPNVKELGDSEGREIANDSQQIQEISHKWLQKGYFENVVVKRSEKGLSLFQMETNLHLPTTSKEIFDVSGAGDTVVATIAFALANRLSIAEALALANFAASFVISKMGTSVLCLQELRHAYSEQYSFNLVEHKIVQLQELQQKVMEWQAQKQTIVFTNGCFDLLHIGHIKNLQQAATFGDKLIVGINSDDSVKRLKGDKRPYTNEVDRALMVASLQCVDAVILFSDDTPLILIETLEPTILVKGGDYEPQQVVGHHLVKQVQIVPTLEGYSTSQMIENIVKRESKDELES